MLIGFNEQLCAMRLAIAYSLIGLLVLLAVGAVTYLYYNTEQRRYIRRTLRERRKYEARLAQRGDR